MKEKIIDLTHLIVEPMPVYPGTEQPQLYKACTLEDHGFRETKLSFYSHTGTHMDAPAHMLAHGKTLDEFTLDKFVGEAVLLDFKNKQRKYIEIKDLEPFKEGLVEADFLIINTGWSSYWGKIEYFSDFPALSSEAAQWLKQFNLKGVGIDTISIDSKESGEYKVHKIFFNAGMVIVENLTNLEKIKSREFIFSAMPLKYIKADGAPVRAAAIIK